MSDLKQEVDRKKQENKVYQSATRNTNINVKEISDHPDRKERAIIKGLRIEHENHLGEKLRDIEGEFMANDYPRKTVRRFM